MPATSDAVPLLGKSVNNRLLFLLLRCYLLGIFKIVPVVEIISGFSFFSLFFFFSFLNDSSRGQWSVS